MFQKWKFPFSYIISRCIITCCLDPKLRKIFGIIEFEIWNPNNTLLLPGNWLVSWAKTKIGWFLYSGPIRFWKPWWEPHTYYINFFAITVFFSIRWMMQTFAEVHISRIRNTWFKLTPLPHFCLVGHDTWNHRFRLLWNYFLWHIYLSFHVLEI